MQVPAVEYRGAAQHGSLEAKVFKNDPVAKRLTAHLLTFNRPFPLSGTKNTFWVSSKVEAKVKK
jgi:hypothetical protein